MDFRKAVAAMALAVSVNAGAESVMMSQQVTLQQGWNAFYLEVAPTNAPAAVFGDWPVKAVSAYDQSAYLETKQYSGTGSTEGTTSPGYTVWRRGDDEGLSSMVAVKANTIYLAYNTNSTEYTATLYGRPRAPRITWHPSSTNLTMNLVGLSVANGKTTTLGDYFSGLDSGNVSYYAYTIWGTDESTPKYAQVYNTTQNLSGGAVLAMTATKTSDWSGVLSVSPADGIDFGTDESMSILEVANASATNREVRIELGTGVAPELNDLPPVPQGLMIKDITTTIDSLTNAWTEFTSTAPFKKTLAAGETLKLALAVDRTKTAGPAGTYYGGLLTIADETADGSNFRAVIPVELTSDGGVSAESAWPKGIWLAQGELDTVTFFGDPVTVTNRAEAVTNSVDGVTNTVETVEKTYPTTQVASGGKFPVRLPMYVDREGKMTLLQRFWYGRTAEGELRAFSGNVTSTTNTLYSVRRVSSAVLPADQVEIAAQSDGVFGASATFPFTVAETSAVNPLRHPFHPQHDGYAGVTFDKAAPSGDDFNNYLSTVKPELFSITNRINFAWNEPSGTAWNPDEKLTGKLTWELDGVRHEGTIIMKGNFTMKRVSSATIER